VHSTRKLFQIAAAVFSQQGREKIAIILFLLHAESELKVPSINWDKRYFRNELAYS